MGKSVFELLYDPMTRFLFYGCDIIIFISGILMLTVTKYCYIDPIGLEICARADPSSGIYLIIISVVLLTYFIYFGVKYKIFFCLDERF